MAKQYLVEQYETVTAMEERINDLYLKPTGERYDPITVTETTENFTVLYGLFKAPYRRT
jgi:SOS-response transcriptional repressor LexA